MLAMMMAAGCHRAKPPVLPPQTATFQTIDRLVSQVEAIPDPAKRAELMGTIERIRGQLTFGEIKMPPAARLLLAKEIHILPMTQVADWNSDGTPDGFEVQVEAFDHFGDPTKIVGKLYFEMYAYRQAHTDRRALQRSGYWEVNIESAEDCARYWDRFERAYHFNLVWSAVPEPGKKYIFQVTYVAPWGEILETQRTLTRTR